MITIYVDDSGSKSLNDSVNQPIFLFSAICIPNDKFPNIESDIRDILSKMNLEIRTTLIDIFNKADKGRDKSKKLAEFFLNKSLDKSLEIHCSEIIRGDDVYMLLDYQDREKYIIETLKIIKKYDIKVITVYCDKEKYKEKFKIDSLNELENKKDFEISDCLIQAVSAHLGEQNEQGCIVIDAGNQTINKTLIPNFKSGKISVDKDNIGKEIMQVQSHDSNFVQIADVCAYINNMKLTAQKKIESTSKKKINRANKLYEILDENNIQIDILGSSDSAYAKKYAI